MIAFWNYFIYFAMVAVLLWAAGACAAWKDRKVVAYSATIAGLVVFFSYILIMWISLDRPPMRTMGETRLWYSFFLPLAGIIVYSRWDYKWLLSLSTILALVFIGINLLKPEIHSKTLMPALQSPWFAPHVIIYMFAYALLGAAFVMAVYLLFFKKSKIVTHKELDITDNLVYIGWACLRVRSGQKKPGGTTGLGTRRRPGQLPPGWLILPIFTTACARSAIWRWLCGYSS